MFKLNKGFSSF